MPEMKPIERAQEHVLNRASVERLERQLAWAVIRCDELEVEELLARGVNPITHEVGGGLHCAVDNAGLSAASGRIFASVLEASVSQGRNLDACGPSGQSALMLAVLQSNPFAVRALIKAGADPQAPGNDLFKRHPIHYIGDGPSQDESARLEVLDILLQGAAMLSCRTTEGATALQQASIHNFPLLVKKMLEMGADPLAVDKHGDNAAHTAFEGQASSQVLHVLAQYGVDMQCQNVGGFTPLHRAALRGAVAGLACLLEMGVPTGTRSVSGMTAREVAHLVRNSDIEAMFDSHDAGIAMNKMILRIRTLNP